MKTELLLIRHGETYWNKEGKLQGVGNSPLTDLGIRQAEAASEVLTDEQFDAVYSSPSVRARETAEIVTRGIDCTIIYDEELMEWNLGVFEGLTITEIQNRFAEDYTRFISRDPEYIIPKGESSRQRYERTVNCFQRIAGNHPGERLLVITHRGVLDAVIRRIMFVDLECVISYSQFNCGLNTIEIDGDTWRLQTWGDARHLKKFDGLTTA